MLHTLRGLEKWYEHSATHLGWMVIIAARAKQAHAERKTMMAEGLEDNIRVYLTSLNRLDHAIEERLKTVANANRRTDLEALAADVMILLQEATRILAS